jgi:aldehyde dehydrogenase (NAD+)
MNPGKNILIPTLMPPFSIPIAVTGRVLTRVPEARLDDVETAVAAARKAFETVWGLKTPGSARGHLLYKLAELVSEHADRLAALEALDVGKTYIHTRYVDVEGTIQVLRYFAGWSDKNHGKVIEVGSPSHSEDRC